MRNVNSRDDSPELKRNRLFAAIAAFICFLIGWHSTGKGIAATGILGTEYGGFAIATVLLIVMVLAYWVALQGYRNALVIYLVLACVSFACNLNWFYPNYYKDDFIRRELRDHLNNLANLRDGIKSELGAGEIVNVYASVMGNLSSLQEQIKQGGYGTETEKILDNIDHELGLTGNDKITRLSRSKSQSEHDAAAEKYKDIVIDKLAAHLAKRGFNFKTKVGLIDESDNIYQNYAKQIDVTLKTSEKLERPPYIEKLTEQYRDICKREKAYEQTKMDAVAKDNNDVAAIESLKKFAVKCNENYTSPTKDFGTFTHTFKSVWNTLSEGSTWAILMLIALVDFIIPLALYLLVHGNKKRNDFGWNVGNGNQPLETR